MVHAPERSVVSGVSAFSNLGSTFTPWLDASQQLNQTLDALNLSPFVIRRARNPSYAVTKGKKTAKALAEQFSHAAGQQITPSRFAGHGCRWCVNLLDGFREKFNAMDLDNKDKYRMLTCTPTFVNIDGMVEMFKCSKYMARVASKLRHEEGVFSFPVKKVAGHYKITSDVQKLVRDFYLHADNSKILPNTRETVLVFDEALGERVPKAKQLMLTSQSQFYLEFRQQYPSVSISLSSVAMLKPGQVRWARSKGFPQTCLCIIHQNYEMLLHAVGIKLVTGDFLKKIVCPFPTELCYLGLCNNCCTEENLITACKSQDLAEEDLGSPEASDLEEEEDISYCQWLHQDRTNLVQLKALKSEIVEKIAAVTKKVMRHHFIMKKQQEFFKELEDRLPQENSVIVNLDFAENYSFCTKNEVQGFHWNNAQMTIHPFYVRYCYESPDIQHKSYVVVSDCLDHNASTIHVFRKKFLELLKADFNWIEKIYYVSDGTGAQYKNYKNFINIMHHERECGIKAELHFSASYHGKNSCDAMSAVVKRSLRIACNRDDEKILDMETAYEFCRQKLAKENMQFIKVTLAEVIASFNELDERYSKVSTVPGTQSFHCIIPDEDRIICKVYSSSSESKISAFGEQVVEIEQPILSKVFLGCYVGFRMARSTCLGMVQGINVMEKQVKVLAMQKLGKGNSFQWPTIDTILKISSDDLLVIVNAPSTETGRIYKMVKEDYEELNNMNKTK